MVACWQALGVVPLATRLTDLNLRLLWATLPLVGALLLAAALVALAKRWRKRDCLTALGASEQLARFQALYERGQMSAAEFERVRALLHERLRREMEVSANPTTPLEIRILEPETAGDSGPNGLGDGRSGISEPPKPPPP